MSKVLISESNLTDIADAIRYKKSSQDTYKPSEMAEAIESIDTGGGGGSSEEKTVIFYDYDGTIVNSYTKSEFLALESMPSNPSHSGLTAQGWNWSLADAKTYVTSHDYLNIGQMYVTDNGETRIYITLDDDDRLNPYLGIGINGTVTVDWGDGNTQTITGTSINTLKSTQHTYSTGGDYVIRISGGSISIRTIGSVSPITCALIWSGSQSDYRNYGYANNIKKIELGNNVININEHSLCECRSLESITIPDSIANISGISVFANCYSLKSIIIPSGVTGIGNYAFYACYSLESVIIPSGVTSIGDYAFQTCYSLKSITIPDSVTDIGTYAFTGCGALQSVTISNSVTIIRPRVFANCYSLKSIIIPSGVTSISTYAFYACYSLESVIIPSGVTSIGDYAFQTCFSLKSITIPDSVTSIGINVFDNCFGLSDAVLSKNITNMGTYTFQLCYTLNSVTLPSNITSIPTNTFSQCRSLERVVIPSGVTSIGGRAFQQCHSLNSVVIPDSVTSIGGYAFYKCYSLESLKIPSGVTSIAAYTFDSCYYAKYFDFSTHTSIPTLANTNAFSSIASDCKIIVPDDLYDSWKAATNWSTYARRIVKESDYNA